MLVIRLLVCLFVLLTPGTLSAQSKTFNRTVAFQAGGSLRVNTDAGSLKLSAWERNEVEIVARIEARTGNDINQEEARRAVEEVQILIGGNVQALSVKAVYGENNGAPWNGWNRPMPRIEWEIRAPRQANLEIDIDRSEADVRGFEGRHRLKADRTVLNVADLSGEIQLSIDRGRESRVTKVRGTFHLEADRTDVIFEGLSLTGNSDMQIERGKLLMQLANRQGVSVSMNKERRSTFKSDLPLTANTFSEDKIEGTVNGGGPQLTLKADRAQVYLRN